MGQHRAAAEKAIRSGDWAGYGEAMKKFFEAFERLEKIKKSP
jgi:hypothetical protein